MAPLRTRLIDGACLLLGWLLLMALFSCGGWLPGLFQ